MSGDDSHVAVHCSMLQCVVMCCSVMQGAITRYLSTPKRERAKEGGRERERKNDSVLQRVAECTSACQELKSTDEASHPTHAIGYSLVAVCSVLQCIAVRISASPELKSTDEVIAPPGRIEHSLVAVCCSVLQCIAVCCSVWQCVAVCCSVLQCVAVCCSVHLSAPRVEINGRGNHPSRTIEHSLDV